MQLTPSQRKALDTSRHLAITANAGSGKTRVLVKRYVDILENNSSLTPRNILAVTYTESAGAELRTRIAKEITDRLDEFKEKEHLSPQEIERRTRLKQIRDGLASAMIGTIHSFASRLLRAYPVEANVDAAFGVLDASEQRLILENSIGRVFYSVLEQAYGGEEMLESTLHTFRTLGRREMMRIIRSLFFNRARVRTIQQSLLAKDDYTILEEWKERLVTAVEPALESSHLNAIESILSLVKNKKSDRYQKADNAQQSLAFANSPFEKATAFGGACKEIFTAAGKVFFIKDEEILAQIASESSQLWNAYQKIERLLPHLPTSEDHFLELHGDYLSHLRSIFFIYDLVLQNYTENKIELGVLDFDDLIEKTLALVSRPDLQPELRRLYPFIMFDEYQDTDQSQFEIVRHLTAHFSLGNNLAVVGDPKQSIYGFRNAEFKIFHQTVEEISKQTLTKQALQISEYLRMEPEEEYGSLLLAESFRMAPKPLALINSLFKVVMGSNSPDDSAPYTPLVAGRLGVVEGSVEFLLHESEAVEDDAEEPSGDDLGEAELIARKIYQIAYGKSEKYYVHNDEQSSRPPVLSDMAILLRSRTNLPIVEKALRKYNIPYIVAKGAGFFSQQEVTDAVSYLKFLSNPSDDISLMAVLRSPYFAVSDEQLFKIAVNTRDVRDINMPERPLSFWERANNYLSRAKEQSLLKAALNRLRNNLLLVGRLSGAAIVERINAESGIYATLLAAPQGFQKVANLEKFLNIVRASDESGFVTLFDLVERLNFLIEEADSEAQAAAHPDQAAVQIMTVHGAKGLEFPIVFASFLGQRFRLEHQNILDPELGLLYNYPDTEENNKPAIVELMRLRAEAKSLAEEERILYVALTRARDHLIMSGTITKRMGSNSALSWIFSSLPEVQFANNTTLRESILRYQAEDGLHREEEHVIDITIVRKPEEIELPTKEEIAAHEQETPLLLLEPIMISRPSARFSASQFLTYSLCPTKYYLAYTLGIPEEPKLAYDLEADEFSERVRGALLGQIIHKLLERIDHILTNKYAIDFERFETSLRTICSSLGITLDEEIDQYRERALADLSLFARKHAKAILKSKQSFVEHPVQALIGERDRLFGIIDRLYLDNDDIWTVLDYKTDTLTKHNETERRERHNEQLKYYAYLVSKLYPDAKAVNGILLYTKEGEMIKRSFTREELRGVEASAIATISRIRKDQQVKELSEIERNLKHCTSCNFYDTRRKECLVPVTIDLVSKSKRNTGKVTKLVKGA